MISVMQIEQALGHVQQPSGNQWHLHTVVPDRFHLSRSADDRATIFIEGDDDSFGRLPVLQGIEYRSDATEVESGRVFGALRITAPSSPHGNEAVTFIAFEIARGLEQDPDLDNSDLLAKVGWILALLGREPAALSGERQRGLVAECLLLRRMLQIGRAHSVNASAVLERWWGPAGGKRDFAATGIAVEVKSTALNARNHHIASIDQLEPLSRGEQAYLYSVGIKAEPTYDRKLPTYIADVVAEMIRPDGAPDLDARYAFQQKLASAGYDPQFDGIYASGPGLLPSPALPARLFREDDLDRLRLSSFKEDQLPQMVTAVSYDLEITAPPLSKSEADAVLLTLISSPAI